MHSSIGERSFKPRRAGAVRQVFGEVFEVKNRRPPMPRLQRIMAAGFPQHVVQRGNNREDCFFTEADYAAYLHWLERAARTYRVAIHAYVLMTNHVHLLVTPGLEGGVSRMMQISYAVFCLKKKTTIK